MDKTTSTLASYVAGLTYDQLTPAAIGAIKNRLIDSIGCAIGGYSSEPAAIARRARRGSERQASRPHTRHPAPRRPWRWRHSRTP